MLALSVLLISEYKDNFLRSCLREAFVIRWIPRFDLMGLKHIEWIQMTGLILSNSSSIHIFLWLKSPPQSSRFLWCFFRKKKKKSLVGLNDAMLSCSCSCQEKKGTLHIPMCVQGVEIAQTLERFSFSFSLSSYLPPLLCSLISPLLNKSSFQPCLKGA